MTVKWQGRAKFHGKIAKLPKAVGVAVRAAMEEAAQDMVETMKRLAPVDTGALRDSINWCWGDPPKGNSGILTVAAPRAANGTGFQDSKISIFAGDEKAYYARMVEFGTINTPQQAFFWPAWRAKKKSINARMTRQINKAIKEIAAHG